ncbi:MAG: hypothetical protein K6T90_19630 [Leptolyngbyaceae cyanobacterium HOT.MB2.61]|jgi:hypothetical protein|nr:hypothetical protein [Leptolyngbyaceae cyanobacterium HOT.MB2.61]
MKVQFLPVMVIAFLAGCSSIPGHRNNDGDVQDKSRNISDNTPNSVHQQQEQQNSIQSNSLADDRVLELPPPEASPQSPEVALASHLKRMGAILYDAENCTYCRKQQSFFGAAAFQQLRVVNCGPWNNPSPECRQIGIRIFPTWEIGGKRYPTILPLEELAAISGFNSSSNTSTSSNLGSL